MFEYVLFNREKLRVEGRMGVEQVELREIMSV